jgi:hypothetical protein
MLSLIGKADAYRAGIDLDIRAIWIAKPIFAENVFSGEKNVFCAFEKERLSCAVDFAVDAGSIADKECYGSLICAMLPHIINGRVAINEVIDANFDIFERHGERRHPVPVYREHGHPLVSSVKECVPHIFCANLLCVLIENWRESFFLPIASNGNDGISQGNNVYGWNISEIFRLGRKYIGDSASFIDPGVRETSLNNSNPWPLLREIDGTSCNQCLPRQTSLVRSDDSIAKHNDRSNADSDSVYALIACGLFVSGLVIFAKGTCYAVNRSGDDVSFFRYAMTAGSMIVGGLIIGSIGGVLFLIVMFPVH